MSGHRHRHRLRHIANPHCWFRRPSDEGQPSELPLHSPWAPEQLREGEVDADREREREEEEYNMALALSLSANEQTRSISLESQEEAQLARATRDSMAPSTSSGAAQSLSWSLFTNNCLSWEDSIVDGLYDVWGQFPEISPEGVAKLFPSLEELRQIPFTPGDSREVVVVDHDHDEGLCTIDEIAAEAVSNAIKLGAEACVTALVRVVVQNMGGPASAGELAQRCWDHMQQLKYRRNSLVLPIGAVKVGLARHRALLFKCLADACRLPCRVVRGEHLGEGTTGDRAAVMVRLQDKLFSVDLFSADLRLIGYGHLDGGGVPPRHSAGEAGGLEWHGELDGPSLLPLQPKAAEGRPGSGHQITPSIDAAFDAIDAKLQHLETADQPLERIDSHRPASSSATQAAAATTVAESSVTNNSRAQYVNASLARRAPLEAERSLERSAQLGTSPEYPPIVYQDSLQLFADSPAAPHPFLPGTSVDGEAMPATSSILERLARPDAQPQLRQGPSSGFPPPLAAQNGEPVAVVYAETAVSPFQNLDFQSRPSMDDEQEYLGGSFEFINGRVAEVTPSASKGKLAVMESVASGCLAAPSPFADPAVQDNEVPYDNLPVDKGHLLPPPPSDAGVSPLSHPTKRRLMPHVRRAGSAGPEGSPSHLSSSSASRGTPPKGPRRSSVREPDTPSAEEGSTAARDGSGAPDAELCGEGGSRDKASNSQPSAASGQPPDEKAHWKLRALANIRRHSDSDIFLDVGRRSTRETRERLAERLEGLPELTEGVPLHAGAGDMTRTESRVPPAKPLSEVSHVALGDSSASSLDAPDEWEIKPEEIKLGPRIGIGSFGEVYRGTWRYTDVAVKRLLDQELSAHLMEEFRAEIGIMKRLRHVNVLLFLGAVTQPPDLAIVTQFMPRGSLFRLLHRTPNFQLDEKRRLRMALDIARGMNYLHSCVPPIVHRDLKTPNLLVDKDFTVKVCDFGLSRVRMSTILSGKSQAGTPEWTAPEVLRSQAYDESSDCYSYGVILWELLTNEEPWQDKTAMQVVGAVGWGDARLQIPVGSHPALASLILRCWSEPKKRPTFGEVLQYLKPLREDIFVRPPTAESEQSVDEGLSSDTDR